MWNLKVTGGKRRERPMRGAQVMMIAAAVAAAAPLLTSATSATFNITP